MPLPPITRERRQVASGSAEACRDADAGGARGSREGGGQGYSLAIALIQLSLAPAVLLVLSELGPQYVQQFSAPARPTP